MSDYVVVYTQPGRENEVRWRPIKTLDAALEQAQSLEFHQKCQVLRVEGPQPMSRQQVLDWFNANSAKSH